jgi:hypothetical protein
MILLGTPKRCMISLMNFASSSDVTFTTGGTSIHLVNLSDGNQNVFVAAWGGTKRSYSVKTPHGEGS